VQREAIALAVVWLVAVAVAAGGLRFRRSTFLVATGWVLAVVTSAFFLREARQVEIPPADTSSLSEHLLEVLADTYGRTADPLPEGLMVERFADDLGFPVSLAWERGTNRMFFTQRDGAIRILRGRRPVDEPCAVVDTEARGPNDGLLGLALDPRFKETHWLYVYYTNRSPSDNRVVRYTVDGDTCVDPMPIITGIPAHDTGKGVHHGGQLEFVGEHLIVTTGDTDERPLAQDRNSLAGKILRLDPDGGVPASNPLFGGGSPSPVWAYGFRNPFGVAGDPDADRLFVTDNGSYCADELDVVLAGSNHGWGPRGKAADCLSVGVGPDPQPPALRWDTTITPTDVLFYSGRVNRLQGLLIGDFRFGFLHRVIVDSSAEAIVKEELFELEADTRILDVEKGPGGWPYVLAIGADGTGQISRILSSRRT
jgi:glucose/arabinose dehydrogenase